MLGILAYGSLITDPGAELLAVTVGRTEKVLTPFPVEYARSSDGRGGAPTLVPFAGGSQVEAVIFTLDATPDEAASILYRREINQVGSGKAYREPAADSLNAVRVERFEHIEGYDLVLSTRLAPTIDPLTPDALADLAIESARKLGDGRDGIGYLIAAQASGISTPLTPAYKAAILAKTSTSDLESALASIRREVASR
jgi:hypothetical protein